MSYSCESIQSKLKKLNLYVGSKISILDLELGLSDI